MAGSIRDIHLPFRDELLPASFRNALFHVEANSKECGRRIVLHEFPKRDIPYAEDMGRRVKEFSVRGYCITFPVDTNIDLYRRDYRIARDKLIDALETNGPDILQLPTMPPVKVVCPQYRWSEESRAGGFCIFDMTFIEYGVAPSAIQQSVQDNVIAGAEALRQRILTVMTNLEQHAKEQAGLVPKPPLPPAIPPKRLHV